MATTTETALRWMGLSNTMAGTAVGEVLEDLGNGIAPDLPDLKELCYDRGYTGSVCEAEIPPEIDALRVRVVAELMKVSAAWEVSQEAKEEEKAAQLLLCQLWPAMDGCDVLLETEQPADIAAWLDTQPVGWGEPVHTGPDFGGLVQTDETATAVVVFNPAHAPTDQNSLDRILFGAGVNWDFQSDFGGLLLHNMGASGDPDYPVKLGFVLVATSAGSWGTDTGLKEFLWDGESDLVLAIRWNADGGNRMFDIQIDDGVGGRPSVMFVHNPASDFATGLEFDTAPSHEDLRHVRIWRGEDWDTPLTTYITSFPGGQTNPVGTPVESPFVDPEPAPPVPTTEVPVITDPTTPTMPQESPGTTIPSPANEIEEQTNRQEGMFDRLIGAIGNGLSWLGDIFGRWIRWLFEQLQPLFDALGALLGWLGELLGVVIEWLRMIRDAIVDVTQALGRLLQSLLGALGRLGEAIVSAVLSLPGLIIDGLRWVLVELFVPSSLEGIEPESCEGSFPCGWVLEAGATIQAVADGLNGQLAAGCVAPGIGWEDFRASLPPPDGCSAAAGSVSLGSAADEGGNLFGWRVALRAAAFVALGIFFVRRVIGMTPWAESQHYAANPEQQTLF